MKYVTSGSELLLSDGSELKHISFVDIMRQEDIYQNIQDGPTIHDLGLRLSTSFVSISARLDKSDTSTYGCISICCKDAFGKHACLLPGHQSDHIVIGPRLAPIQTDELDLILRSLEETSLKIGDLNLAGYLECIKHENEWTWLNIAHYYDTNAIRQSDLEYPYFDQHESPSFRLDLFDYQKIGSSWLSAMIKEGVGVVLGDGMGLGKTAQTIKAICDKLDEDPGARVLVVCPSALVENWRREIDKFTRGIEVQCHFGPNRSRYFRDLSASVIITTYDIAKIDAVVLSQHIWDIIVLDEAQFIKNPDSQRSKAIKTLPKRVGIAVTGTPFENHVTDIWSILDFCYPDYLGSKQSFVAEFKDEEGSAHLLGKVIAPLLLRRTLDDIPNDLPERISIPMPIALPSPEAGEYDSRRQQYKAEGATLGAINKLISDLSTPESDNGISSLKFQYLETVADEVFSKDEKIIVFADRTRTIEWLARTYARKAPTFTLTGEVPTDERVPIVDKYSAVQGGAMLLCNTRVAATGLNITAANHVFHFTLSWNPAVISQADARAHRHGQTRPVICYYPFYASTVEEYIWNKLETKRSLFGEVVKGHKGESSASEILEALNLSPIYQ